MFTGIIMGQGVVVALQRGAGESRFILKPLCPLPDLMLGESIAVNGVCLTAENQNSQQFTAYASAETMNCTTLGNLVVGSHVNLERALALGDRLGGHMVSGHVDGRGTVLSMKNQGLSKCVRIQVNPEQSVEIISKGSVALDGISLTVNQCGPHFLEVNIIPETWRGTTVARWVQGTEINIETDMLGKYVRRMLAVYVGQTGHSASDVARPETGSSTLSLNFLRENGFA